MAEVKTTYELGDASESGASDIRLEDDKSGTLRDCRNILSLEITITPVRRKPFFIAPAMNARSVCRCQPMVPIISASVAPFFRRSIATTLGCSCRPRAARWPWRVLAAASSGVPCAVMLLSVSMVKIVIIIFLGTAVMTWITRFGPKASDLFGQEGAFRTAAYHSGLSEVGTRSNRLRHGLIRPPNLAHSYSELIY